MAKGDKKDVAKAKAAYAKLTVKSYAKYPKTAMQQRAWEKASAKAKGKGIGTKQNAKAIKARDKSSETTRQFNKVNNQRLEIQATRKYNAANKMKANPKIMLSPTSSALERAKAKKGK